LGVQNIATANILRLGCTKLSLGSLPQPRQLIRRQLTQIPRFHVQHKRTVAHAANLLNKVADFFEHLAQLTVATLNQHHFVPGIDPLPHLPDPRRSRPYPSLASFAALYRYAAAQNLQFFLCGLAAYLHQVGLLHAGCGFSELVCQLAVVGDHQQSLAQVVQPSDRIESLAHFGKELHYRAPAFGVLYRGHVTPGLVQHEVAQTL
jgi:hypothetical protein